MIRKMFFSALLVLLITGCATTGSQPQVTINMRQGYSQKITSLIAVIKTDGIPQVFSNPFVANLKALLVQHKIKSDVKAISDLDLDSIKQNDVKNFSYVMVCIPTKTFSNQYALQSVTMNCTLTETKTHIIVMKADATANKGFGYGFGDNEAQHVTQELINKMEAVGLIESLHSFPDSEHAK